MSLNDKVAIITGSSRGIGKAIATRLAADGATVVINYSHSPDKANAAVEEIKQSGGKAIAIGADVSQVADLSRLFAETIEKLGKVDILVNCAGVVVYKPIVEITEADFDKIMAVNVKTRAFPCVLRRRGVARQRNLFCLSASSQTHGRWRKNC